MTFSSTKIYENQNGSLREVLGSFSNDSGSTGGEVDTCLSQVMTFEAWHTGSGVVASCPVANETFPLRSRNVTLITVADTAGQWRATGY